MEDKKKIKHNSGFSVKVNMGGFIIMLGNFEKKNRRGRGKRKRTSTTYNKKVNRLKSRYIKLCKNEKFKTKYPTFESFLEKIPLKQVDHGGSDRSSYTPTTASKTQRKSGMWGM